MKRIIFSFFFISAAYAQTCTNYTPFQSCTDKCCDGKCQAASCDGNKLLITPGNEKECVLTNINLNQGSKCPWSGKSYGIKCSYSSNCQLKANNNCYGKTVCASGTCPTSALDLFCLESGNSDNFKICACDDINCQVSEWAEWGPCVINKQTRYRTIIQQPSGNGKICPALAEIRECIPDVDCVVSSWSDWGPCVSNVQTKTRSVVIPPSGKGQACPTLTQTQSCGNECDNVIKTKADFYVAYYNKKLVAKSILSNDKNVETVSIDTNPQNGELLFNQDGTFTYTPNTNYCGTDTFVYKAINDKCYAMQEVVITTTCGCGALVETVTCNLDLKQSSTKCQLPNGKVVTVANIPGYTKVILNISAKPTYKKK